jgi:Tol biopolymer transport system component
MRYFPILFLLYGTVLIAACQPIQDTDNLPATTVTEMTPATHTPAPPEPLATNSQVEEMLTATPTASVAPTATNSLPDDETPVPAEVTVTPSAFLPMRGDSFSPAVSADGRAVVFVSRSSDLVEEAIGQCPAPDNSRHNCANIFLFDAHTGQLQLVTRAANGQPANGNSVSPVISDNSRWVAFVSEATNLSEAAIDFQGLFLYDAQNGRLELIASPGSAPSISADGRFVVYSKDSPQNVYLYDHETGRTELISRGWERQGADGDSLAPQISADGRWVAFWSWAGNLAPEESEICRENEAVNYSCGDMYIFDRQTGQLERIPVGESYGFGMGGYSVSLSDDGNRLAFNCQVYERDVTYRLIASERCGRLSGDGRLIAFRRGADFFAQDVTTGATTQVSIASDGAPSDGELVDFITNFASEGFNPGFDLSPNGRWIVFATTASNLDSQDTLICEDSFFEPHNCYDIYIHDRETGVTEWISKPIDHQSR